jgi:hypothetical protein
VNTSVCYLLDANVFIEANRRYYAFDICPGFWDALLWHHGKGHIGSIDRVRDELTRGNDALKDWVEDAVPSACFSASNASAVTSLFGQMMAWVHSQAQFQPAAKAEFAVKPDGWLVAYAKANGLTVVTHEVPNHEIKKKVPIPNVCEAFSLRYVDTFDMLRGLKSRLDWNRPT